jgi:hypothetical protein
LAAAFKMGQDSWAAATLWVLWPEGSTAENAESALCDAFAASLSRLAHPPWLLVVPASIAVELSKDDETAGLAAAFVKGVVQSVGDTQFWGGTAAAAATAATVSGAAESFRDAILLGTLNNLVMVSPQCQ